MVREHEHRVAVGRVLAPPATPRLVWPRPAYRAKHVPPHDRGADVPPTFLDDRGAGVDLASVSAVGLSKRNERK
jgi:hypothetical protein